MTVFHFVLICISLMTLSSHVYLPSIYLLQWHVYSIFHSFVVVVGLFLLLSIFSIMYIFQIQVLSQIHDLQIFFHYVAFFLIFLRFSLEKKMLPILMKSNSSVFSFMDFTFIVVSNRSLIIPRSQNGFPMLSLWSFTVLDFIGRFMIHFELISE